MGVVRRLVLAVALVGIASIAGAQSSTLNFSGTSSVTVQLQNVHYDPGTTPTGVLNGSGDLVCDFGGGNRFTSPATPFKGIFADSAGNVQKNKAGYTFNKEFPWNNMCGSGLNAKLKPGFTIIVETSGRVTFTADTECQLPFRDSTGTPATLSGTGSKLTIDEPSGALKFDTNLVAANMPKIAAAGFGVTMVSPHLTVQSAAKPTLLVSSANIKVSTPVPSLLTSAPMELSASNFSIDETGLPNFDSLTIGAAQASIDMNADMAAGTTRMSLLQPANFGFEVTGVSGGVTKGKLHNLHINGNLVFPDEIKNEDNPSESAAIPISFDISDPKFTRSGTGDVKLLWQPVASGPKLHLRIHSFTLDTAKGLRDLKATLTIEGDERFGGGQGVTFQADGVTVDGNGVTGTVSLTAPINMYGLTCNTGSLTFDRDTIAGGAFFGQIDLPGVGKLGVAVGVSDTGTNIAIQPIQELNWAGFGKLSIKSGSGSIDSSKKVTVNVSGDLSLNVLQNIDLAFDDLQIDSNGKIKVDELALTKPVEIPIGPLTLHANKLVYKSSPESFRIDGDVKFPDSLPITGDIGFEGLTIPIGAGKFSVGKVTFKASIDGLGSVGGMIQSGGDYPDQGFKNVIAGDVDVSLECLGGAGLGAKFLMADGGAWLAAGHIAIPGGIALPPPPPVGPELFIIGFGAGFGHNIGLRSQYPPPTDANPFTPYKFVDDNWLVEGSVDVTTTDHFLAWGTLRFDVGFPHVQVSLTGDVALLTPAGMDMDPNRSAHLTMGYFGDGFELHGNLTLAVPLFKLTGGVDAKIGSKQGYIYVGWPVKEKGIANEVGLSGVVQLKSAVGVGLDLYPDTMLQAGMEDSIDILHLVKGRRWANVGFSTTGLDSKAHFDIGVEGSVDFVIVTLSASASAALDLELTDVALPKHASLRGRFEGKIETFLGDVSVHAEGTIISW